MSFLIAALRVLDVVWMSGLAEVWLRNSASSGKLEFVLRLDSGITCANAKTQISKIIIISVLICAGLGLEFGPTSIHTLGPPVRLERFPKI